MNGLPYYRRFPRHFLEGTAGMPLELKGPYSILLDLMYLQNGELPDDARYISGNLGCSVRMWQKIRAGLISAGKIIVEDGVITNVRMEKEVAWAHRQSRTNSENAERGWHKRKRRS